MGDKECNYDKHFYKTARMNLAEMLKEFSYELRPKRKPLL